MLSGVITTALTCFCLAYIGHTVWTMYHIYHIEPCVSAPNRHCLPSWLFLQDPAGTYKHENLAISVYGSSSERNSAASVRSLLYQQDAFDFLNIQEIELNVSVPQKTFSTGKYYLHMYLHTPGMDPLHGNVMIAYTSVQLTQLSAPKAEAFNLVSSTSDKHSEAKGNRSDGEPVPHWRSRVTLSVMTDNTALDARQIPPEIYGYIKERVDQQTGAYLPIAIVDKLSFRLKHLEKLDQNKAEMPLTITYQPMGVGKLRLWTQFDASFHMLGSYGFGETEIDEVKGIFVDTNFFLLLMTVAVSALHILFDTLAFKNDISYWRNRKTMVGLSSRAVVWRCVSTFIILGYLIDSNTSLLVTVPTAISAVIETWKLKKALKISFHLSTRPISFGAASDKEKETEQFDAAAMGYLAYILYPLLIAGAIYSLLYTPHKSWWSWALQSLVNGVYAFGFIFMLPQLFVNYKLKSVAHLPWRAFMYKAFNTFIDDVFAFIITMPNAHRLACFRDDVVFVIYLIQRWQYPVDKSRVNEFGQSFEEADSEETKKTK